MDVNAKINDLEAAIGYSFFNKSLPIQALTHSSFANEMKNHGYIDYERMEFLGDAVLELTVSEFLYKNRTDMNEGNMTKLRASLVCEPTLAYCSQTIPLNKYILLGKGEEVTGGRNRDSVISDVFEALIGAIYLDGGMDNARAFIEKYVLTDYENKIEFVDSKTILQEITQEKGFNLDYIMVNEEGPAHNRIFTTKVMINGREYGLGVGSSKKKSEQHAAYEAIKALRAQS